MRRLLAFDSCTNKTSKQDVPCAPRRRPSLLAGMLIRIAAAEQSTESWRDAYKLNQTGKDERGDPLLRPPPPPKKSPRPNILLHLGLLKWLLREHRKQLRAGEFQHNSESRASHAERHSSIDGGCLLHLFLSAYLKAFSSIKKNNKKNKTNQWSLSRTNFFFFLYINPKKQNTETTFQFQFFLLDIKSVTLIFRLYFFFFRLSPWIYRLLR